MEQLTKINEAYARTKSGELIRYYPQFPGYKAQETSKQAAEDIKPKAEIMRRRVLECIKESVFGLSPDQVAGMLGENILSVRPRFSELKAKGLIQDSGRRSKTAFGKSCIIWLAI